MDNSIQVPSRFSTHGMNSSPSYEEIRRELADLINEKLKRTDQPTEEFATVNTAKEVLTPIQLERVYRSLHVSESSANLETELEIKRFVTRVGEKCLHSFLAVLLFAGCSIDAVRAFAQQLVGKDETSTPCLPASREHLAGLFDEKTVVKFWRTQPLFSTIVLREGEKLKIPDPKICRFPWIKEEGIGEGSFGKVYKVEIAEGHFIRGGNSNQNPVVVARKEYLWNAHDKTTFEDEVRTMRDIFRGSTTHRNILESLGSFETGSTDNQFNTPTYSLLLPLATQDLEAYLHREDVQLPLDADSRMKILRSAWGIADGLKFLHEGLETADGRLVCYHLDLKPSNILIFPNTSTADNPEEQCDLWKISDFGISKVKMRHKNISSSAKGARKIFSNQFQQGSASATINFGGMRTYLPSETEFNGKSMNAKSDVWSLGCIISVLFVYMESGGEGLDQYAEDRARESRFDADVFYGHSRISRHFKNNQAVKLKHDELEHLAGARSVMERRAVHSMLGFLTDEVLLIENDYRCTAKDVAQGLSATLGLYRKLNEKTATTCTEGTALTPPRQQDTSSHPSIKSPTPYVVHQWRLGGLGMSTDAYPIFKGSCTSPNGEFITYWNDDELALFTKGSVIGDDLLVSHTDSYSRRESFKLRTKGGPKVLTAVVRQPAERGISWKAAKLTNDHLIAATTGGSPNSCYVFDVFVDQNLKTYNKFTLPRPEVYKLDVSADGRSLTCILGGTGDSKGYLWSVNVRRRLHSEPSGDPTNPNEADAGVVLTDGTLIKLPFPASEVLHLMITSPGVCLAVRPRNLTSTLKFYHFTTQPRQSQVATITKVVSDSALARTFTDMACIDSRMPSIVAILRAESLYQIRFRGTGIPELSYIWQSRAYRILKITANESTGMILALGTISDRRPILLLILDGLQSGEPKVKEVAQIPGLMESSELGLHLRIYPDGDDVIALITANSAAGQDAVYQAVIRTHMPSRA